MGMQEMREELEDLSFRMLDPEAHAVVMQRLDSLAERNRLLIGEIESQLTRKPAKNGMAGACLVSGRRKQPYSIWRKMERKSVGFEQLSDIFGFRVVVETSKPAIARSASCTRPGRWCPAASRTTSRRRSRTIIARSTPR
jgi:guanosine-3',5'-bis(diphosphate) 3'-pyrophosphohydrolase